MNRTVRLFGLTSGMAGAVLSVIDVTIQPFFYELEALLRAPTEGVLAILRLQDTNDAVLWNSLEIGLNTVLFAVVGASIVLLTHFFRVKWHNWTQEPYISTCRKLVFLAAAWGVTIIACLPSGHVTSLKDFGEAALWFPMATVFFIPVPWGRPEIGWPVYGLVTCAAVCIHSRRWYFVIYGLLCALLLLNVVSCHCLPPRGTNLM